MSGASSTGSAVSINIQNIPTPELWLGSSGTGGGGGPLSGMITDPEGDYILDENGNRILPE
jgi:hypothetical protein